MQADAAAAGTKKAGEHAGKGQAAAARAAEEESRRSKTVDTFGVVEALKQNPAALKAACTLALAGVTCHFVVKYDTMFSVAYLLLTGTHWATKFGATVSPHLQQYKLLYTLFCDRISMNLYSQQQIEGLFNQFDLVPIECSEVTYAAMIAARKNNEMYETLETEVSREELRDALNAFKKKQDDAAATFDGLNLVAKTSCETDGGQAPSAKAKTSSLMTSSSAKTKTCRCGSTTHLRINHRDCPLNKKNK